MIHKTSSKVEKEPTDRKKITRRLRQRKVINTVRMIVTVAVLCKGNSLVCRVYIPGGLVPAIAACNLFVPRDRFKALLYSMFPVIVLQFTSASCSAHC